MVTLQRIGLGFFTGLLLVVVIMSVAVAIDMIVTANSEDKDVLAEASANKAAEKRRALAWLQLMAIGAVGGALGGALYDYSTKR